MMNILVFLDRWSNEQRAEFLVRVGSCLDRGFSLKEALLLQQAEARPTVKKNIDSLLRSLKDGHPVAHVLNEHHFSEDVVSYLHFSTHTGSLSTGFREAGNLLLSRCQRRKRMGQLLRYPIFLLWMVLIMGTIIVHDLLPNFKTLYDSMSISLPPLSLALLSFSAHLPQILLIFLFVSLGVIAGFFVLKRNMSYEQRLKLLISLPILSPFIKLGLTSSFAAHFGSLLKIGMAINQALDVMGEQSFHPFLKNESHYLQAKLNAGLSLSSVLARRTFYTKDLATVIVNGSESGRLGPTLVDYSQLLFNKLEQKLNRWILFIQPFFFFLIGGFLLVMFLSLLLPMFDMMKGL
ncbi:competence type IV pilus assembly protein ComGB [Pullulanibacillus sp. KACC 23026]|uniref:competence type IV pilus assembly protein ComGB n=1 Tax=Pullulanibacillus sp. KACC 23026 TaxID=3028315 RepID=UPI0023B0A890|nr:competence type IV pilus assembly protein ComGB [Pullulanibacillus sp. KACC 23026]WEG14290.1 competence type IV pilus assembly protein ComGB [Pullulanibacillus sp. KACC 23026]